MTACAELEIGLHRRAPKTWTVELRFRPPGSESENREEAQVRFDLDGLRELVHDVDAYGQLLTESLFKKVPKAEHVFTTARRVAGNVPLRVRLLVGTSAPELHEVWWETLRDPEDGSPLLLDERIWFSRYLSSKDWRPTVLYPKSQLRALVAIANPSDHGAWGLPSIDVDGELKRFRTSFAGIPVTSLGSRGTATLERIAAELRKGHDLLYLVCHGYLKDEPQILLENDAGKVDRIPGGAFVAVLEKLPRPPCLVVLASCESAGPEAGSGGEHSALAALGPRMAEVGVPAVLAMQGQVTMQTVGRFIPVFFKELERDGQVDRAMTTARAAVQRRHDWWAPVMFTRLRTGCLWRAPGFEGDFARWPGLRSDIEEGRCTPVLGPGFMDAFIGSRREIAQEWARRYHYPLADHQRDDLPHVAQYLAVEQGPHFPRDELQRYMQQELRNRHGENLRQGTGGGTLAETLRSVGAHLRSIDGVEPHAVLARLPLTHFVTAGQTSLLEDALKAAGKNPQVSHCHWRETSEWQEPIRQERLAAPTVECPLVYHLFGSLEDPDTLVLTEDEYFDYLIAVTKERNLVPTKLAKSSLLFLGFQLDEWDFRVLFRSIIDRQGAFRSKYHHVAVQIDPGEDRTIDPDRARRHLEQYFSAQIRISIYWGSLKDFMQELDSQWRKWVPPITEQAS